MYKVSMYNNTIKTSNGDIEIYNSFTKARIRVDDEFFIEKFVSKINNDGVTCVQNEKFETLLKNGFVVNSTLDETHALQYVFNKRFFSGRELGLILMPTLKCNFTCPYCFEYSSTNEIKSESKNYFDVVEKYITKSGKNYNLVNLSFFGGEPLLKKSEIIEFSQKVLKLSQREHFDITSTMITNGSLLDIPTLNALSSLNCKLLQITLDGSEEQHNKMRFFNNGKGSCDLLLSKISTACDFLKNNNTMTLLVRFNLYNTSVEEVRETLSLINKNHRKRISLLFRTVFSTDSFQEKNINTVESIEQYNQIGFDMGYNIYNNQRTFSSCEACSDWNFMHILPDLSLWKCIINLNVNETRFGKIAESGELQLDTHKILAWYSYSDFFTDAKCNKCSLSPDCLGGCIMYFLRHGHRKCGRLSVLSSPYRFT